MAPLTTTSRRAQARAAAAPTPAVAGFRPAAIAMAIAFTVHPLLAQTQPRAVVGAATLSQQGRTLLVTTRNGAGTQHSVIDWKSFSVAPGAATRFLQPDAASTSINRVLGATPSGIYGTLSSNGRLVLVNPAGIAVGPGGVVDTAGFIASTLRLSDADAASGRLRFGGGQTAGAVAIQGRVLARGGDVVLVGPDIEVGSAAVVTSPHGAAILAAGRKVEVTGRGLEGIHLELQAPTDSALNLGRIEGDAVGLFAGTLRHSGLVQATAATQAGGKVVLKAREDVDIGGRVEATRGALGGQVHATADRVVVRAGAVIDASGPRGGGEVLVGGGWQGHDARVANASDTVVETGATLRANATGRGDGGTVVVWSDDQTRVGARIEARGGPRGGDGGAVETSGKGKLVFRAQVDTSAPRGQAGSLLLDPQDITIVNDNGGNDDTLVGDNTVTAEEGGSNTDITLSQRTLEGLSGNVTLQASRDVIFANLGDNTLDLQGVGPGSAFSVEAGRHILQGGKNDRVRTGGGDVNMTTANGRIDIGGIFSRGGNVSLAAGGGSGTLAVGEINTTPVEYGAGGHISLSAAGAGTMVLGRIDARGASWGASGDVKLLANGAITVASSDTLYGNHLKVDAKGGFHDENGDAARTGVNSLQATNQAGGDILVDNDGSLLVTDMDGLGYGVRQSSGTGRIHLNVASGQLRVHADVTTTTGAIDLSGRDGGVQVLGSTVSANNADITIDGGGWSGGHAVEIADNDGRRALVRTLGTGNITIRGELTGGGFSAGTAGGVMIRSSSIAAGSGDIAIVGKVGTGVSVASRGFLVDGDSTVRGGGSVSLEGETRSTHSTSGIGGEIAAGGLVASTGGNVTVSGTFVNQGAYAGVGLRVGGTVQGASSVTLQGVALVGPGSGQGVLLDAPSQVIAGTGGVNVSGDVGSTTSATNLVAASLGGTIDAAGDIAISGTVDAPGASLSAGVSIDGYVLAGGTGGITVTGAGATTAIRNLGSLATAGGQVDLVGDSMEIAGDVDAGSGIVTIAPKSRSRDIALGTPGSDASHLHLSQSELDRITAARIAVGGAFTDGQILLGGLSQARPFSLQTTGAIRQESAITVAGLSAQGGSVDLSDAGNLIGSISGSAASGSFSFRTAGPVEIGAMDGAASGIAAPNGSVLVRAGGDLKQSEMVSAGAGGDAVVLAGANYENTGAPIVAGNGRWLVYSTDPASNSFGGLDSGNFAVWDSSYDANAPSTIAGGNRYVFALRPTVSVMAHPFTRVYDGTATFDGLGFSSSGLVDASAHGNVFLQDALSGGLEVAAPDRHVGDYAITQGTLAAPPGYSLGFSGAFASITPKPVTVSGLHGVNREYDGGVDAAIGGTGTIDGVLAIDAGSMSLADVTSGFFEDKHVGTGKPIVTAIRLVGEHAGNYMLQEQPALTADITQATLTISASSDSRVYDGTTDSAQAVSVSGLKAGDSVSDTGQSFTSRNVMGPGGSTLAVDRWALDDGNHGNNYRVVLQTASGTITPAALALYASGDSRSYDGTTDSWGTVTAGGLVGGDGYTASQSFTSRHVLGEGGSTLRVGSYSIDDGNGGANYTVSLYDASGTITPALLGLDAVWDSRSYDGGTASGGAVAVSGLFGSDTVGNLSQSFDSRHVRGPEGSVLSVDAGFTVDDGNGGANYTVRTGTASGTITPAALMLYAASDSRTYDATTGSAGVVTSGGLFGSDSVGGATQSFTSRHVMGPNGSTLAVDAGFFVSDGNGGANYTVSTVDASGTITPASVTLYAASDSRGYNGGTSSAGVVTSSGLLGTDRLDAASQKFTSRHVRGANGSTLVVDGFSIDDGNGGNNYAVNTVSASGTITPATLNLYAASDTRMYDGGTASSGVVGHDSLYGGDSISGLSQSFTSRHVLGPNGSTLAVNAGFTVDDGNGGANYAVRTVTATGTLTPAPLTLAASSDSRTYDGGTDSSGAVSASGLFGTDTVTGATQSFASRHVMGPNGSTLVVNGGHVVDDGNGGANYEVVTRTASGTITPATLKLKAAADSRTYDGTTRSSGSVTSSGLFGGDSVSGASQSFASKDVKGTDGSTLVVDDGYAVSDGNGGNNYLVTRETAKGTITPATLTLQATSDSRGYDGTTLSSGSVTHGGLFGTDSVSGATQSFTSRHVRGTDGSLLRVDDGFTVHDGNGGNNYVVSKQAATGTITPATLTLQAVSDSRSYDGGTGSAGVVGIAGLFGSDTVSGATQSFASRHVMGPGGSTLRVDGGYVVDDGNGGANYAVATRPASGTITPAALTLHAASDSRSYDGTTGSAGVVTSSGLFGGDAVSGATQSFASRHVMGPNGSTLVVNGGYTVADGNAGANYSVTTASAAGTITPALLTLQAASDSRTYDATTDSAATVIASGLFGSDSVSGATQSFESRHVLGTGNSTLAVNEGFLVTDGNGGANYSVRKLTAPGTISPASLVIRAGTDSRAYDGTTASAGQVTASGLRGADTLAAAVQKYASKDVKGAGGSTLLVDTFTVADGNGGNNYAATTVAAMGTITPAALTIASSDVARVYDGSLVAAGSAVVTGGVLFKGDALAGGTFRFSDRHVGTGKTITASGVQVDDGNGGANYSVTYADNRNGTITVRPLSTWTGAAGDGLWSSAANWDALPDFANVLSVRIPEGASVLYDLAGLTTLETLASGGVLRLAGGTLAMAGALSTQGYEQRGGLLTGAGSLAVERSFSQAGGAIDLGGAVSITQAAGDLETGAIRASRISLRAQQGAIRQSAALVTAGLLETRSRGATVLDHADNRVAALRAAVEGTGDLRFTNTGVLDVQGLSTAAGSITLVNTGGIATSGVVQANGGSLSLTANSPLTIGKDGVSASGDIELVASNRGSPGDLTLDGEVRSTAGAVSLVAGRDLLQNSLVAGARGVSATAEGTIRFAPAARTEGSPVSYSAAGEPVTPPGAAPASGSPRVDAAVGLLGGDADADTVAQLTTALQQADDNVQVFVQLLRKAEEEAKAEEDGKPAINADGATCKP
ncbi:MAG: YDG domain-containing protein [Ramlibacter sp.]